MARPLRIEEAGMWYHVMNRGNNRKNIFSRDNDYIKFLEILSDSCAKYNVEIHSYVLMPNHFHFFLKTNEANLSRFMQRQLTAYIVWFNRKYKRSGHLFQGRYKSIVIDNNKYGTEITRYIHLNPVRTHKNLKLNLREKRKYLKNYKWSSYPTIVELKSPPTFLYLEETLEKFGLKKKEQIKNYLQFVGEGLKKDLDSPLKNAVAHSVLGSDEFISEIRKMICSVKKYDTETDSNVRKLISLPIERIFDIVCKEYSVNADVILKSGGGRGGLESRRVAFYLAKEFCVGNMSLREIGHLMGCNNSSSVILAHERIERQTRNDINLTERLKRMEKVLTINA